MNTVYFMPGQRAAKESPEIPVPASSLAVPGFTGGCAPGSPL